MLENLFSCLEGSFQFLHSIILFTTVGVEASHHGIQSPEFSVPQKFSNSLAKNNRFVVTPDKLNTVQI
jgi:hypothetical protein